MAEGEEKEERGGANQMSRRIKTTETMYFFKLSTLLSVHQARENRAEREALQELVMSREKETQTLTSRLAESQDAVCQLKQLVENHVASEREKNKRVSTTLVAAAEVPSLLQHLTLNSKH